MYTSCGAITLFTSVIFPQRTSLQSFQHPIISIAVDIVFSLCFCVKTQGVCVTHE